MRHVRRSIGLATVALLLTAGSALASPPHLGCPVGPDNAGSSGIQDWELWDEATLTAEFVAVGIDPSLGAETFATANRNGDDYLCVLKQILPNDASGNTTWFVSRDNTAREK